MIEKARREAMTAAAIVMTLLAMLLAVAPAQSYADAGKIEDGYVNKLLDDGKGNTIGWDEGIIKNSDAYSKSGQYDSDSDTFVNTIDNVVHSLSTIILWIVIALLGFRIAGRAVLSMMIDNANGSIDENLDRTGERDPSAKMLEGSSQIPTFFLTSKERGNKGKDKSVAEDGWFKDMLIESFKYLGLAVGVWLILALIMSVVSTIFAINPGGFDTFSFGGTSVTTS